MSFVHLMTKYCASTTFLSHLIQTPVLGLKVLVYMSNRILFARLKMISPEIFEDINSIVLFQLC